MRLDPESYDALCKTGQYAIVTLDGVEIPITTLTTADEEAGEVERFRRDLQGQYEYDLTGLPVREVLTGRVEIRVVRASEG